MEEHAVDILKDVIAEAKILICDQACNEGEEHVATKVLDMFEALVPKQISKCSCGNMPERSYNEEERGHYIYCGKCEAATPKCSSLQQVDKVWEAMVKLSKEEE